ncbi:hypothetical protein MJ1_0478 [Nanobdella aerobiophila]|uniref:VapC9 PIN-like domain-containing protein n=1 Tax=Nanobdella aerobiophila TaxID=2586965 RepID=A0A915SSV9_9ARCH|nr:hypothetical protein [Nanobdella aerobiophila]BBL45636.1 hypothetical protein MJ1_0478 [Nanobdella aerobiophila]
MQYKILIDSNVFFIPFYYNYDIIEELKLFLNRKDINYVGLYTLRKNIIEIEDKLKSTRSEKSKKLYKLVLDYINKNNINIIETNKNNEKTDRLIVNISLSGDFIVCTQDKNLRYILRKLKVPVIFYSNKELHIIYGN